MSGNYKKIRMLKISPIFPLCAAAIFNLFLCYPRMLAAKLAAMLSKISGYDEVFCWPKSSPTLMNKT